MSAALPTVISLLKPRPFSRANCDERERHVAALGDHGDGPARDAPAERVHLARRAEEARAVGADHAAARRAEALDHAALDRLALGPVSPKPAVMTTTAGTRIVGALVDHAGHEVGPHEHDGEVDGPGHVARASGTPGGRAPRSALGWIGYSGPGKPASTMLRQRRPPALCGNGGRADHRHALRVARTRSSGCRVTRRAASVPCRRAGATGPRRVGDRRRPSSAGESRRALLGERARALLRVVGQVDQRGDRRVEAQRLFRMLVEASPRQLLGELDRERTVDG